MEGGDSGMVEKITNINALNVGIGSVIFILASYATFIVNSIKKDIENVKDNTTKEIEDNKKDIDKDISHHRQDIMDLYESKSKHSERITRLEAELESLKSDIDRIEK